MEKLTPRLKFVSFVFAIISAQTLICSNTEAMFHAPYPDGLHPVGPPLPTIPDRGTWGGNFGPPGMGGGPYGSGPSSVIPNFTPVASPPIIWPHATPIMPPVYNNPFPRVLPYVPSGTIPTGTGTIPTGPGILPTGQGPSGPHLNPFSNPGTIQAPTYTGGGFAQAGDQDRVNRINEEAGKAIENQRRRIETTANIRAWAKQTFREISQTAEESRALLDDPRITAQVEIQLAEAIKASLADAEKASKLSLEGASFGVSEKLIHLLGNLALNSVHSIRHFLLQVQAGVFQGNLNLDSMIEILTAHVEGLSAVSDSLIKIISIPTVFVKYVQPHLIRYYVTSATGTQQDRAMAPSVLAQSILMDISKSESVSVSNLGKSLRVYSSGPFSPASLSFLGANLITSIDSIAILTNFTHEVRLESQNIIRTAGVDSAQHIESEVVRIGNESLQLLSLPRVTAQMEQAASDYIRNQIADSQAMAHIAVTLAQEGAPKNPIRLLGDYAKDKVTSIHTFLTGFHQGINNSTLTTAQAINAIYSDPTLITNLSNNVMYIVTSGPIQIVNTVGNGLTRVGDAMLNFELTMTYGSASDRGLAAGEFSGNVLLGLAGGEVVQGIKAGLQDIARDIVTTAAADGAGSKIVQEMKASVPLAPQVASVERARRGIENAARTIVRHGPMNAGPLHRIAEGTGTVADTFRSGSYLSQELGVPTRLYRVQSHAPNAEYPLSHYWTRVRPTGSTQSAIDSALARRFRNDASNWIEIEVPAGRTIHEGVAAPINTNTSNLLEGPTEIIQGGGNQIYIEDEIPHSWIQNSGSF